MKISGDAKTLKWLVKKADKQVKYIILLVVFNAIQATTVAFYALITRGIINAVTKDMDIDMFIKYSVIFVAVILGSVLLRMICRALEEHCKAKLEIMYKTEIFRCAIKKDYASVTSYHSGDLLTRMFNDATLISEGITTMLPSMTNLIVRIITVAATLAVFEPVLVAILLFSGIVSFLVSRLFRKRMKNLHRLVQQTTSKVREFFQEVLSNLLVIKVFSSEKKVDANSQKLQNENYRAKMRRRNLNLFSSTTFTLFFQLCYGLTLIWGAYSVFHGRMDYGTLTAILQLVSNLQTPFLGISGILTKYFGVIASAERLIEIESLPDEPVLNTEKIDVKKVYSSLKSIEFSDITFAYDRDLIFDNTSYSVKKGDFVAIMGISGIGKSTLLKLLLGVFNNYTGRIYFETEDGEIGVDANTRPLFSYVPQGNMLFSGTMRDNITFINENATDKEIYDALEISCTVDFMDSLPQGLDTVIGEKGIGLSEGQIQRVAIARALLSHAPVILLDEATSALDEATEHRLLSNLRRLEDTTLIIISHKTAAKEICNRLIMIEDKKIVEAKG